MKILEPIKQAFITLIAVGMLCVYGPGALAADVDVSWTPPVMNTDGSALPKCASQTVTGNCLKGFRMYHGLSAAALTDIVVINDRNATAYKWLNLAVGTHYFAASAHNGDGVESALSGVGSKIIAPPPPVPNPPTNLIITIAGQVAYKMRLTIDGYEMVAIGSVAPATQCNESKKVDGYSLIPRSAVTMASRFDTLPTTVFAVCA